MKAPYSSIGNMPVKPSDFTNEQYIGLKVRNHSTLGMMALLESRSQAPKRYAVVTRNGNSVYFLSYAEASRYFTSL